MTATATATATAGAAPAPVAARRAMPAPDPAPGWRLVASDDFTGTSLGSDWGAYGGSYGIGANAWSPSEVSVGGGMLHVQMERKTTAGKPYTSGGAAMWGFSQTYGRYEFQAKAPTTPGIDSYITLWPATGDDSSQSMLVELLDKPAVSPGLQAAYVTINYGSGETDKSVPGSYCGAFHDYVIEWTPTYESVTVDGKLLLKSSSATHVARWIGFITSNGDNLTGTPGPNDPLPAEFDIEHLRVYAYSPGAATSVAPLPSASGGKTTSAAAPAPSKTSAGAGTKASTATATSAAATTLAPKPSALASGPSSAGHAPTALAASPAANTASSGASVGIALAVSASGALILAGGLYFRRRLTPRTPRNGNGNGNGSHRR